MTQTLNVSDARKQFSTLINQVAKKETRVLVEKSGAPVAAIVSAEDLVRLQQFDEQRERDFAVLAEIGEAFKDVPPEEIEQEVRKALTEVRDEMRAERAQKDSTAPAS
jgi:prevent-host-death family protein